jgi:hypothetical protein
VGLTKFPKSNLNNKRAMRSNQNISWRRTSVFAAVIVFAGLSGPLSQTSAPEAAQHSQCAAPEFRQFDFWIGDWDAFDADNPATPVARTKVDQIRDGCVLHEDYQDTNGLRGQSFSIYDAAAKKWHQSWVTNRGGLLLLDGQLRGGEMVLSAVDHTPDGKERQVRGSWEAITGGVRETAVTSIDSGKNWKPWFDIVFRPHKH